MKLTLDVENTVTKRNGKLHLDPFEPMNTLVMVGMLDDLGNEYLVTFDHAEQTPTTEGRAIVQLKLDEASLLIMHNAAHDLVWLWESGFKYDGPVFDTMLGEYVLQCGQKQPLSLEACAERYELEVQKDSTLKDYFSKGYSVRDIPFIELSKYLSADLHSTQQLSDRIYKQLCTADSVSLIDTIDITNQLCVVLAKIYKRGFKVDLDKLNIVQSEFEKERQTISTQLQQMIRALMGDTPINLNSPEQLSSVIYSRKPIDKTMWANNFTPYMPLQDFQRTVAENTRYLYKTKAQQCGNCKGVGSYTRTKKDGNPFAKPSKCHSCDATGYLFFETKEIAGLKFNAPNPKWVSAHGFSTSKSNLEVLENTAKLRDMSIAENFLYKVRRLSAVETYLSSFVEGIKTYTKSDGKLHVRLLQHRTSTGRLSGADPNMQNMPRGGTFPVKKVFISQWDNGKILEADFAQLEFRTAAYLSQDRTAIKEIEDGFDVHSYTAKVITDAGQPTTRQEGKSHTFAPLYGATGFGRSKAEAKYYEQFTKKYEGIGLWHSRLAKEAINTRKIVTPSGRQYSFPHVQRKINGTISYFTQIKNYPVQGFATADIVPLVVIHLDNKLKDMKSCIVNTVHDSVVIDVHPDEEAQILYYISDTNNKLTNLISSRWNIDFNVPLKLDAKIGKNWLDTHDIL